MSFSFVSIKYCLTDMQNEYSTLHTRVSVKKLYRIKLNRIDPLRLVLTTILKLIAAIGIQFQDPSRPLRSASHITFSHDSSAWHEQQDRVGNVNDYRSVDGIYGDHYYENNKDVRLPIYDANSNIYPSRKHDWERNNAVIVNSSPPQRK